MNSHAISGRKRAVLIAGPTASGKSALAMHVAARVNGVVINADSMQVYREMRILTARPSAEDEATVPHALYGTVGVRDDWSAARWCSAAASEIAAAESVGRVPVVVGGTGLYFRALTEGLAPVPDVPADVRGAVRRLQAAEGAGGLYAALQREDPVMAVALRPSDTQRLARALEVMRATGRSLAAWHGEPAAAPVLPLDDCLAVVLNPPRDVLRARIDQRFDLMLAAGALAEVQNLIDAGYDRSLPALRALGVPDLMAYLDGTVTLAAAVDAAKAASRQYAKRQVTWFKNQMIAWQTIDVKQFESQSAEIDNFLSTAGLTS